MKEFSTENFTNNEIHFIARVLNHPRSWGVPFYYNKFTQKIVAKKVPGNEIDKLMGGNKHLHGLSVCDSTNPNKIVIYFRKENWDEIPSTSGYTRLDMYRIYLILHEFGHALGHGHNKCTGKDDPAPVMMQQTLGTGKCFPDPWVIK